MICILQNLQLQVLQNSRQWFSSTSRGCEKFEPQTFKKIKFLIFVYIYLPRGVDGRVTSEIYVLDKN